MDAGYQDMEKQRIKDELAALRAQLAKVTRERDEARLLLERYRTVVETYLAIAKWQS